MKAHPFTRALAGTAFILAASAAPLESIRLMGGTILAVALAAAILRCMRAGNATPV